MRRWARVVAGTAFCLGVAHCSSTSFVSGESDDAGASDAQGEAGYDAATQDAPGTTDAPSDAPVDAMPSGCVDPAVPSSPCTANGVCNQVTVSPSPAADSGLQGIFSLTLDDTYLYWIASAGHDPNQPGRVMRAPRAGSVDPATPMTPLLAQPLSTISDGSHLYWLDLGASPPSTVTIGRTTPNGCAAGGCETILAEAIDAPQFLVAHGVDDLVLASPTTTFRFVQSDAGAWTKTLQAMPGPFVGVVVSDGDLFLGSRDLAAIYRASAPFLGWDTSWGTSPPTDAGFPGGRLLAADCTSLYVLSFSNDIYRIDEASPNKATWLANVSDVFTLAVDARFLYIGRENGLGVLRIAKDGSEAKPRTLVNGGSTRAMVVTSDALYVGFNDDGSIRKVVK